MTSAEWESCGDPELMLGAFDEDEVRRLRLFRKYRLFAIPCCRRIARLLPPSCRQVLDELDRVVEHDAFPKGWEYLAGLGSSVMDLRGHAPRAVTEACSMVDAEAARGACRAARAAVRSAAGRRAAAAEQAAQADLVRELFGNPYRP